MSDLAVGIDLGTTNSCVSIYINNRIKVLENSEGGRLTPSFIYFTDLGETVVGEHAKRMAISKPDHGIYEVKRLIGRKFTDHYLPHNLHYFPFHVEADASNSPLVIINQKNKILRRTPQQLCVIILQKLKKDIEDKLNQSVSKVVITVPAYFNVRQREATLAAAKEAGFTVLKLQNEPTAAALTYYFENNCNGTSYSLVYDLGGGTFDVAVLKKTSNNIEIVGVDGDTQLGGNDFDNLIINHVSEYLIDNYDYNPRIDVDNLRRLRSKCEDAKKALSIMQETEIRLTGFVKDCPIVQIRLSRDHFEKICQPLFKRTVDIVDSCLKCCKVTKRSIKEIILCGGSTRIPKIQNMLSEYFDGKRLNKFVNPDECVAEGAALQAAMLSKSLKQTVTTIHLKDVIPLSLGIGTLGDEMSVLIPRNTPIPTSASLSYFTVEDQQTSLYFQIYEGERADVRKNRFLGTLIIFDITPAPPAQSEIVLTMHVDINGILTIKAKEKFKNNSKELKVDYARGDKSDHEIQEFLRDAEANKEEDKRFQNFLKYKKFLIRYCISVIYNFDKKNLVNKHNGVYEFCQESKDAGENMNLEDEEDLKKLVDKVKLQCEALVDYYNFDLMPEFE